MIMYEYFLSSNPKNTPFLAFGKNFDFVLCIIPVITQTTKSFLNVLTLFFFVYKILHWVLKIYFLNGELSYIYIYNMPVL